MKQVAYPGVRWMPQRLGGAVEHMIAAGVFECDVQVRIPLLCHFLALGAPPPTCMVLSSLSSIP